MHYIAFKRKSTRVDLFQTEATVEEATRQIVTEAFIEEDETKEGKEGRDEGASG